MTLRSIAFITAAAVLAAGCSSAGGSGSAASSTNASMPSTQGEWRSLVDPSLSAWRGYKSETVPANWRVENGVLTKSVESEDLVSRDEFGDFELAFDWMLDEGGNAGVFYRATEQEEHIYWTGPEY